MYFHSSFYVPTFLFSFSWFMLFIFQVHKQNSQKVLLFQASCFEFCVHFSFLAQIAFYSRWVIFLFNFQLQLTCTYFFSLDSLILFDFFFLCVVIQQNSSFAKELHFNHNYSNRSNYTQTHTVKIRHKTKNYVLNKKYSLFCVEWCEIKNKIYKYNTHKTQNKTDKNRRNGMNSIYGF